MQFARFHHFSFLCISVNLLCLHFTASQPPSLYKRKIVVSKDKPQQDMAKLKKQTEDLVTVSQDRVKGEDHTYGVKKFINAPLPTPQRTSMPPHKDLERYSVFAAATYCSDFLQDMSCTLCDQVRKGLAAHKVIHKRAGGSLQDVKEVKPITEDDIAALGSDLDTLALVTTHKDTEEIIVTYRGSITATNILLEFAAEMDGIEGVQDNITVHDGFLKATINIYREVLARVEEQLKAHPTFKVTVTGHNLGGAMASLTVFLFKYFNRLAPDVPIQLITFGMPRVGNTAYADYMNNMTIPMARVVNGADMVPHVVSYDSDPKTKVFVHHMREYWITSLNSKYCDDKTYEDPTCSASLKPKPQAVSLKPPYNMIDHEHYFGIDFSACLDPALQLKRTDLV